MLHTKIIFYSDDAIYASLARFFVNGDFRRAIHPTWPPLFPLLSALVFLVTRNMELSLQLVSTIFGAMFIFPFYYLYKKAFSDRIALILACVSINLDILNRLSLLPLSDNLSTFLIFSGLVLVVYKRFNLSSFVFGLAYLTRTEGLMFWCLAGLFLGLQLCQELIRKRSLKTLKKAFVVIPTYTIIFFLTISPYVVTSSRRLGVLSLGAKGSAVFQQSHAFELRENTTWSQEVVSITHPNYDSHYFRGGLHYVLEYFDWFWFLFKQKVVATKKLTLDLFPMWSLAIVLCGVFSTIFRKRLRRFGVLWLTLFAALPATVFSVSVVEIRYFIWVIPIFLFFYALGIKQLFKKEYVVVAAVFLLPIINIGHIVRPTYYIYEIEGTNYKNFVALKNAADFIAAQGLDEPLIMARHEIFEYYSRGATLYFPQISTDEAINYAFENHADFMVISASELALDDSIVLLEGSNDARLEKVYSDSEIEPNIVVYRLR